MALVGSGAARAAAATTFIGKATAITPVSPRLRKPSAIVLIDNRTLQRECFVRGLEATHPRLGVAGYTSIEDWADAADDQPGPNMILYSIGGRTPSDEGTTQELKKLVI